MSSFPERLREQAEQCRKLGSPLYEALLLGVADDVAAGGPVADVLSEVADLPRGSVPGLRFTGALHRLVLERRAPELALHFPSVGGTAPVEGAWPAARRLLEASGDDVRELLRRSVQTNEVGRAAVLFGGLCHIAAEWGLPLRLLEIGASAGLNLRVERFAYVDGDDVRGDAQSAVRLVDPWEGPRPPAAPVDVVARAGCDPAPLDPSSRADRLTLTSYVWGDQLARFERLRAALEVADRVPAWVAREPAGSWLAEQLASPTPGVATVVWQSVVWQYLPEPERAAITDVLDRARATAGREAPLAYLTMEPKRVADGIEFQVRLRTWPDGADRQLAVASGHGPPVRWFA